MKFGDINAQSGSIYNNLAQQQLREPERPSIDNTLAERGKRYGAFDEHARITQAIKSAMVDSPNWNSLSDSMVESLQMIAHKIGRILNGDPNYADSWHDIGGYAKLVEDKLK